MLKYFFRLIYPPKCIFCKGLLPLNTAMEACTRCLSEIEASAERLPRIYRDMPHIDGVLCTCSYSGKIKKAITNFKYYDKPSYYRLFGQLITTSLAGLMKGFSIDYIVGIPLYKKRQRLRGYNQSCLLSCYISRELAVPDGSAFIRRVRDTGYQSHLPRKERLVNVTGAFAVEGDFFKGKSILLVDDILTTGSTLDQCARALREAGAGKIFAVVLATGKRL